MMLLRAVASCELLRVDEAKRERLWLLKHVRKKQQWHRTRRKAGSRLRWLPKHHSSAKARAPQKIAAAAAATAATLEEQDGAAGTLTPIPAAAEPTTKTKTKQPRTVDKHNAKHKKHLALNALILQHAKSRHPARALQVYSQMLAGGHAPSTYTYVAALQACSALRDLGATRRVHAALLGAGFPLDLYVGSALVHAYTRCGDLTAARAAFDAMRRRNVVAWTAMILGYAQLGRPEAALALYARMRRGEGGGGSGGVAPNARTLVAALKACAALAGVDGKRERAVERAREVHGHARECGCERDVFVGTALVDVYVKCGSVAEARRAFEAIEGRNVVAWTAMILGYAQAGDGGAAVELYERMRREGGVAPNTRTLVAVLKAYGCLATADGADGGGAPGGSRREELLERVREIQAQVAAVVVAKKKNKSNGRDDDDDDDSTDDTDDVFVGTALVDALGKCGAPAEARAVLERMPRRDVASWNAMMLGYVQAGDGGAALELYNRMRAGDGGAPAPNDRTCVAALKACCCCCSPGGGGGSLQRQVEAIHGHIASGGWETDLFVATALVDAYVKAGNLAAARRVFEAMPTRDEVAWTALIFGYAQAGAGGEALALYGRMCGEGGGSGVAQPNVVTLVGALQACGSVAALDAGARIHSHIRDRGLLHTNNGTGSLLLSNALIDMYAKCGAMAAAQAAFDAAPATDIVSWNALMAGYARHGDADSVLALYSRLHHHHHHASSPACAPNGVTLLAVLTACTHAGLVDAGLRVFRAALADSGIAMPPPGVEHWTCVVDMLARAGDLDRAAAAAEHMPCRTDAAVWHALLDACRKWRDVDRGRAAYVAARAAGAADATARVLLANVYAACGMREEARGVRGSEDGEEDGVGRSWWAGGEGEVCGFGVGGREREREEWPRVCAEVWAVGAALVEQEGGGE